MRTTKLTFLALFLMACSISGSPQVANVPSIQPLQAKGCVRDATHHTLPCAFDAPVVIGDLIVIVGMQGCIATNTFPYTDCNTVSDAQGNAFSIALVVPFYNGQPLWYATATASGIDTIYFGTASNAYDVYAIAEYPPMTGLDSVNYADYAHQNLGDCLPQGSACDFGWSLPLETHESCELLISWANSGRGGLPEHPTDVIAGPSFTVRATEYSLTLEDAVTSTPGLYIGTMNFGGYGHWMEGTAAFKRGGCK